MFFKDKQYQVLNVENVRKFLSILMVFGGFLSLFIGIRLFMICWSMDGNWRLWWKIFIVPGVRRPGIVPNWFRCLGFLKFWLFSSKDFSLRMDIRGNVNSRQKLIQR